MKIPDLLRPSLVGGMLIALMVLSISLRIHNDNQTIREIADSLLVNLKQHQDVAIAYGDLVHFQDDKLDTLLVLARTERGKLDTLLILARTERSKHEREAE